MRSYASAHERHANAVFAYVCQVSLSVLSDIKSAVRSVVVRVKFATSHLKAAADAAAALLAVCSQLWNYTT